MIKQLKTFTINLVAGANIATVLLMLLAGYSDRLNPAEYPLLSCIGMTFPVFLIVNLLFLFFWLTFKWRKIWIPIVGYLLVYPPLTLYMPIHARQDIPDKSIKIVSYNVCSYGGNYKYEQGFDTVYNYLVRQNADIVCLQEDCDTWRRYVFLRYQKIYPYNDTTTFYNNSEGTNGVGIHTRFPIIRKERIPYQSRGNGSVAYFLKVGDDDTLLVINNHLEGTHLSYEDRDNYKRMLRGKMEGNTAKAESGLLLGKLGKAAAKRAKEAEIVHRYIEDHRQYPTIVCGDFNDNPISYSRRTISEGLTDCFSETGRGIGLSYNQKGFYFRIDHILCSPELTPYNCHVDDKMDASDHFPIICWLKMRENP
jgi:endonuclease/exonuclease/phosphatase family metal-dependent hydrolase